VGPLQARRNLLSGSRHETRLRLRRPLALLFPALLGACAGSPAREADRAYTAGIARVDRIEVALVSTRPPRLRITVRGFVDDACTRIEPPRIRPLGARIEISLETQRPFGAKCPRQDSPFTRTISVMLSGEFQFYDVDVNGVSESVSLPPERNPYFDDADRFD
jgi:inhibitor of cysteine peptidase